ncbi:MAG TPA: hypothetical protein VM076_11720 [Gemmatimonadaceae bacterium]|nr:hypothetical protein [Gemmatimonadaceae bacterium]
MRPAIRAIALLLSVPSLLAAQAVASATAPSPQWGSLTPGRHAVGFRLAGDIDRSRRVAPPADFKGRPNAGSLAMSMQVGVWYPAAATRTSQRMQYGTFAALGTKRMDLTPVTAANRATSIANMRAFAGFAFGRQISEEAMRAVDTSSTASFLDATPSSRRFPVVLAATDGSLAAATVLFEYLASHGIVVMATPSRASYASIQVSRPGTIVEARVRDLEYLLARAHELPFVDTTRIAVLGVNFDGMAALAFQMKNMAARAVVSLDGWEGKQNSTATLKSSMHYDVRRLRVPYLVVEQDEQDPPPPLTLDRTIFDELRYADRQWLVLGSMSHPYLIGNPLAYPDVPADKRASYELLVRSTRRFLDAALAESPRPFTALVTAEGGGDGRAAPVKEIIRRDALPAVPDAEELERLIMVDRAADEVAQILRQARRTDSTFVLFPEGAMPLYAFRFARQNDRAFANRLLELNAEAFPRSWGAAEALGDGYRESADTARALTSYTRAITLLGQAPPGSESDVSRARQAVEEKIARLRQR